MSPLSSIMLSIALAMDCFTVSISCGMIHKRMGGQVVLMALLFGFFQAIMPLIGWSVAELFSDEISAIDHWVAFGLLAFLGGRMIYDGCKDEEKACTFNPRRIKTMLLLAIATSIDALAVGFSFVGMNMTTLADVMPTILIIGVGSFVFTFFGKLIGITLGKKFNWPAEQFGGIILIFIGLRVLLEHLCE